MATINQQNKSAGSSTADLKSDNSIQQADTANSANQNTDEIIKNLQTQLEQVKEVLRSLQTPGAPTQNSSTTPLSSLSDEVKQALLTNLKQITQLVLQGKLSQQQAAVLKNNVIQTAFGSAVSAPKAEQNPNGTTSCEDSFIQFEQSNPDFFATNARQAVKDYITKEFDALSTDELGKIAELVKQLETEAVDTNEQAKARDTSLTETNAQAKKRLASNALSASKAKSGSGRVFSRDEIGKMSTDDFRKNEAAIMDQLRKGQIK